MNFARITRAFTYHTPSGDQPQRYEMLRAKTRELAYLIDDTCPESREKALAFTKLEECSMWANASIARNENPEPERVNYNGGGNTENDDNCHVDATSNPILSEGISGYKELSGQG